MSRRLRVTLAAVSVAGLLALGVVLGGLWLAGRADPGGAGVVTGVEQVGDRIAVVRVDGSGAGAAAARARRDVLRWSLAVLALGMAPLAAGAWLLAGRMDRSDRTGRIDDAPGSAPDAEVTRLLAERERERRQLQDVVHELRTPLAVAATNLDLAVTSGGLDAEVSSQLAAARRGVERLARTVDDLAMHGRLAAAQDSGVVDLAAEVLELAAEHEGVARLRGMAVRVRTAMATLPVPADRVAVHTAVGNLLSNALRLAPAGSVVDLACGSYEDWAWVAVRDEGPGLPPEDHERAFHRYWRGRYDLDRQAAEGGARGIGLTIARQFTEAQGGRVTVRSQVGVGSTFVVWLPCSSDASTEQVVAADGVHHRIDLLPAPAAC